MKIAIDLGGTNIRMARIDGANCIELKSVPCQAQADAQVVMGQLVELIAGAMTSDVEGIGIGVPSVVDTRRGIVYDVANIPSWREVHLKACLEERFGVRVEVNNDCNCFALGETRYGVGCGCENLVGITLGTGVGAGIVANGDLYCGEFAGAGEVGLLPYLDSDFEHYCSSFFFKAHGTSGAELAKRAVAGDEEALRLWDEFGTHLGNMLKAVLYAYAPQMIVFGGGIAAGFPLFEQAMKRCLKDFPYGKIVDQLHIAVSKFDLSGLLGAAALIDNGNR